MTVIMMSPGAMNCMYSYPPTWPTRFPMRLPKITKYSVAVTTGGTMVWPQMRTMRLNSRMMMVENPTHSARARDAAAMLLGSRDGGACADVDQANEEFFEPVHLVPHAVDFDALRREPRENFIQILSLRHFDLERVVVGERGAESGKFRR